MYDVICALQNLSLIVDINSMRTVIVHLLPKIISRLLLHGFVAKITGTVLVLLLIVLFL